jgi:hypothetical protein
LLGIALRVVEREVAGGNGERHVNGHPFAVHVGECPPGGRVGDHDEVPVLEV